MALYFLRLLLIAAIIAVAIAFIIRLIRKQPYTSPLSQHSQDPFETLGVSRNASQKEIKEAYHRELAKYHPDKVAHLGEELQTVAKQKTKEIIEAYEILRER